MPYAHNGRVKLHWEEHGHGAPIILIMGHIFPSELWYPILPGLAQHRRVITFDNRGTGRSDATRNHTIADMADDVLAVMDAAGVTAADVCGVSMGGGIAMELARRAPGRVRSLVLGCTKIKTDVTPTSLRARLLYLIPYRWLSSNTDNSGYGSVCPPNVADQDRAVLAAMTYSRSGAWAQSKAIAQYAQPLSEAARIQAPALVLHGDEDTAISLDDAQVIADTLPETRLIVYPGAGHNFLVSYPDKVVADILDFIGTAAPAPL